MNIKEEIKIQTYDKKEKVVKYTKNIFRMIIYGTLLVGILIGKYII